jgi:hypothetical protein
MRGMGQNAYNEMLLHAREANQSPVYIIDPKSKCRMAEWKEKWKQRKKQEGRRKERN